MLELHEVCFSYSKSDDRGAAILLEANLRIIAGEILCVLGESGSGKTTLLNLLAGTLSPTAGAIERRDAAISYLLQDDLLLPFRTVWQNSFLAAELQNSLSEKLFTEGRALLGRFRLEWFLNRLPSELSGGMRRRVALARQLLGLSNVLLLDEPFGSQDRGMRQILEDTVHQRCRSQTESAVIVTHDIDSAVALADRVVILNSMKRLQDVWKCPQSMSRLEPTLRRAHPEFGDHVAEVWREFWKATSRG